MCKNKMGMRIVFSVLKILTHSVVLCSVPCILLAKIVNCVNHGNLTNHSPQYFVADAKGW